MNKGCKRMLRSSDLDFGLIGFNVPKEPRPLEQHRLLVYAKQEDRIVDTMVSHIGDHLEPGDVLVFNNSRVLPVSLYLDDVRFILVFAPAPPS